MLLFNSFMVGGIMFTVVSNLSAVGSNLIAVWSNLIAVWSNMFAVGSNLSAVGSNLRRYFDIISICSEKKFDAQPLYLEKRNIYESMTRVKNIFHAIDKVIISIAFLGTDYSVSKNADILSPVNPSALNIGVTE